MPLRNILVLETIDENIEIEIIKERVCFSNKNLDSLHFYFSFSIEDWDNIKHFIDEKLSKINKSNSNGDIK
jgi:hypothetical protein